MIKQNITTIKAELGTTKLLAVSKYQPIEKIQKLYDQGQRLFGENRVLDLIEKKQQLPKDIQWHLIGNLQSKKVKKIIPHVSLIHSVDREKLLEVIEIESEKAGIVTNILLQLHIAQEETKSGFEVDQIKKFVEEGYFNKFNHVNFCGLMCMATNTENSVLIDQEFSVCKDLFDFMKDLMPEPDLFVELSMGMSNDYKIAVKNGSTMVRLGRMLFD